MKEEGVTNGGNYASGQNDVKEKLADEILNALDDILQLDWPVYKKKIMEALLGYAVIEKEQETAGPQKL